MLTVITQMFGVRGEAGGLTIRPQLLAKQFDAQHQASISLKFMGIMWEIRIENPDALEVGEYIVGTACLDGEENTVHAAGTTYTLEQIQKLDERKTHHIRLLLTKK